MMSARVGNGFVMVPVYQSFCHPAPPKSSESTIFGLVRPSLLRFLAQLAILLAIATSVALLVDTLGATPAYCSGATGCHAAKVAARKVFGSVPLPLLGLLAFYAWLVVTTLHSGRFIRLLETTVALIAAVSGITLLVIQAFVLKSFCPLCVIVDVSAVVAAVVLLLVNSGKAHTSAAPWLHPVALGGLALAAGIAPVLWPHFRPATAVPPALSGFSQPGRVTIVEFVDLGCSHCRELYPTLEQLRKEQARRVHFVRLHAPPRTHRHARDAARLLACLYPDEQRIAALTEVLFENPSLDRASVRAAAQHVGMAEEEITACLADPASEAAVEDNLKRLEALGFQGLPTTYVGGERIVGSMPMAVYLAAIERVQRSSGSAVAEGAAFYAIFGMSLLGIVVVGRRGRMTL